MWFCIALVWVATLWLLYKHYRCVLWLNRSPRRSEIGQSFYLNFTSRGIPAANGFNSCQHVRWTRLRGGAQRREKMEQSISLPSDAHDCLSSLPKWGMWHDWTISRITPEKYEPLSHTYASNLWDTALLTSVTTWKSHTDHWKHLLQA